LEEYVDRGKKPKQESRSTEFRRSLIAWKQIPESQRPSLRTLACEFGTSHQLLSHLLNGLEKWQEDERYREAKNRCTEIRSRAENEKRPLSRLEEEQIRASDRASARALLGSILLNQIEKIKREATRGPLNRLQFKMVMIFAKQGFPGAEELLLKCLRDGLKKSKLFADIVKETPREEGEACVAWVRRIWNQCDKYDTECPAVITEELLQKLSRGRANKSEK
jgi:hypothetical protein